jgi:sirohydrochlorin ferrochelatase
MTPPLVAAAHGTRSVVGAATVRALISQVRGLRPELEVDLCYLDVQRPRLGDRLDASPGPVVVVPLLLSAGYHVTDDIPSTAADRARVARHLGPDPAITQVLALRLAAAGGDDADVIALVGSPSTRTSAGRDLAAAAADLAAVIGRPVHPLTVGDSLTAPAGASPPRRLAVATYLLSEGHFFDVLRTDAAAAGAVASEPLGAHPAMADLIVRRYDEALVVN